MPIPSACDVLVIGGGPAGSYAAACLAREGVDTVVLEADKFPRYHIGESTLPSLRHFFQFIDFDKEFDAYGFYKKIGAVFKLSQDHPDAHTDFIASGGPGAYAWNLIRSESDDLLFRHAGSCGANIFDETRVNTIQFDEGSHDGSHNNTSNSKLRRPISATWSTKDGSSGTIIFRYLVDASGRSGILSNKYLKNRKYNQNFKNVANWAYWKTEAVYGPGSKMETAPYFEALQDSSGWAWFMPLHDGTRSVGVVQDQKLALEKKRSLNQGSGLDFYKKSVEMAPGIHGLLAGAELVTDMKSASDWSYTSSEYHIPYARVCGDAGSFIDPLFSSGVHLAITGGLSAAVTIMSSLRGDLPEPQAGGWHTKKTIESYTRFFLAVSSATKQIRSQEDPELDELNKEGFQQAFDLLQPIIQGTVDTDASGKTTQSDISKIFDFCFKAFNYVPPEQKDALFQKLKALGAECGNDVADLDHEHVKQYLTPDELQIVETLRSRRMIREDPFDIESFTLHSIDGLAPRLEQGKLGLVKAQTAELDRAHFFSPSFLDGKVPGIREGTSHPLMT